MVVRFEADLFFANISRFKDKISAIVRTNSRDLRAIVVDASMISNVDTTALHTLEIILKDLQSKGVTLVFACMRASVRDRFKKAGLAAKLKFNPALQIHAVVKHLREERKVEQEIRQSMEQPGKVLEEEREEYLKLRGATRSLETLPSSGSLSTSSRTLRKSHSINLQPQAVKSSYLQRFGVNNSDNNSTSLVEFSNGNGNGNNGDNNNDDNNDGHNNFGDNSINSNNTAVWVGSQDQPPTVVNVTHSTFNDTL